MRHLIIPNSFFPRVGGVQTSLLSFIKLLPEDSDPIVALGARGFKFSFGLKRKFKIFLIPYFFTNMHPIIFAIIISLLVRFKAISVVWLYGGGDTAISILKYRNLFPKRLKIILRSSGDDLQINRKFAYGPDKKMKKAIMQYYKNCTIAWALSNEIKELYLNICNIEISKLRVAANAFPTFQGEEVNSTGRIGVIGRNHPKKQFDLAESVAQHMPEVEFSFLTPGYMATSNNIKNLQTEIPSDLLTWPPENISAFYRSVDIILVTSAVESFGNINIEAGIHGCSVVINETVTGSEICKELNIPCYTYKDFDPSEISELLKKVLIKTRSKKPLKLKNHNLLDLINEIYLLK